MNCPPDLTAILCEMLSHGILCARASAWSGDAERSALEADHIHNLPHLLKNFSADSLRYYWDIERAAFAARCSPQELQIWHDLWQRLHQHVQVQMPTLSASA